MSESNQKRILLRQKDFDPFWLGSILTLYYYIPVYKKRYKTILAHLPVVGHLGSLALRCRSLI